MRQRTLVAVSAVLVAVGTATLVAQSKLADFGIREADVKANTVSAFIDGNPSIYPSRKAFNGASPSVRAAFVRNTLAVVKSYTETATFQAEYAKQRASARPSAPASKGSPDEQYAKYLADRQKSIADMKASVAKMSPDMQKQMLPMVKQMEEAYAQQAKNPQMVAIMKQGFVAQGQASQKEYQNSLAQYESKYPADPKVLIASRLHQFLDLTKDIPWNAKLVPNGGGGMRFADPQYESKGWDWKICFRAGREPVEAARAFAAEWLKQLGK